MFDSFAAIVANIVEQLHAARYPEGCPAGCEACTARAGVAPVQSEDELIAEYERLAQRVRDKARRADIQYAAYLAATGVGIDTGRM